ncbi:MAG: EAL domain-containing protein [Acidocella sp.]|nr:EAL domain-containing protein [Acidocella sp.]MDE8349518.1 EAL domain-containing protein [Acidocella sp.]
MKLLWLKFLHRINGSLPASALATRAGVAERVGFEQATVLANIMRMIVLVGVNTAIFLGADFVTRPSAVSPYTRLGLIIIACILVCYLVIFTACTKWLKDPAPHQNATQFIQGILVIMGILCTFWGVLIVSLTLAAGPRQLSLIYGVIVACLAMPALVAPVSVAFTAWAPIAVFGFISLLIRPDLTSDPFAIISFFGFVGMTGFAIIYLNRRLTERALDAVRIEENSDVIRLLLRDFEESASDWLWETDADLELQRVSPRLSQVAQKSPGELAGKFPEIFLGDMAKFDQRVGSPVAKLSRYLADRSAFRDLIVPVVIGGEERCWSLTGKPILDKAGRFIGYHGVGSDVTAARRSQEQIAFLARHDSLTRLPNRVLFNEVLHQSCSHCEDHPIALLCLDLDNFKMVNDSLGHATGDAVLVAVGERIRGCIRDGDTAARLGGDEFAIILATDDAEEVATVARRVVERISRPYHFDGRLVEIGISIGISLAPKDSRTPAVSLKNADLALYRAKSDGRGTWRFYDFEMDERLQDRRSLQADLREALLNGEFRLDFQPIIELSTGKMVAAEALLRWHHPTRGLLSPALFVPLAEEAGLIAPIGAWVLRQACMAAAKWPSHISIAVNLSPVQFRDKGLVAAVDEVLAASGLAASRLELEITETTVLETNSQTVDALWQLHGRGVRVALDDFGTGYSSLSYLRRFPFDKIKIDRSFVRDLGHEKDDTSIILAIIALAGSMNMLVTAEGVETMEQASLLTGYGCPQAQGYLFCRPVPERDIPSIMTRLHQTSHVSFPTTLQ